MSINVLKDLNEAPSRSKEMTIHMSERQAIVLRDYCLKHYLTPDVVVLAALCAMIESFEND